MLGRLCLVLALCGSWAGAAAPRGRCATAALRDLPTHPGFAIGITDRPASLDSVDSAVLPLRVHRASTAVSATHVQVALGALEDAWRAQVDGAGFPAPLLDDSGFDDDGGDERIDVYLGAVAPGVGALTVSGRDRGLADRAARPVFLRIDPSGGEDLLVVTAHHEFHHAVQFAVDALESPMAFESAAVAWEVRARPDLDLWQDALPSFQLQPQAPFTTDARAWAPFATDGDGLFEYGAALFSLYLDHVYGDGDGTLWRDVWLASRQPAADTQGEDNEPDWLDAFLARPGAPTFADVVLDFAAWRALTGPLTVDDDGPGGIGLVIDGRGTLGGQAVLLPSLSGIQRTTTPGEGPFVGGCAVFVGTAPSTTTLPVRIEAASVDGHDLGISVVVVGGQPRHATRHVSDVGAVVSLDVDVAAGRTLVSSVCDVSVPDADDAPVFAPVRLRLARRDVPAEEEGEGEGEGEGDEGEGEGEGADDLDCGCACAPAPSTPTESGSPRVMRKTIGVLGLVVGLLALGVRGGRAWRRRRLYRGAGR